MNKKKKLYVQCRLEDEVAYYEKVKMKKLIKGYSLILSFPLPGLFPEYLWLYTHK